jgi:hypothetical protein
MQGVSKELYNGIPNVTVWRALRKRLHLKVYKLFIVQHLEATCIFVVPKKLHVVQDLMFGFACV